MVKLITLGYTGASERIKFDVAEVKSFDQE